ncbi:hypothetical protein SK128_016504 [Halocaridina rubra]|uniref:DH domain-containing protein n=1 Tax=Halocaridina rubra TaxID=373956 RepID=A0AAN8WVR6_HALRR
MTISKGKRSWGDLLKFRARNKERQLSPVPANHPISNQPHPPSLSAQTAHNYLAEYRQKYGAYNGTIGHSSFQAMTVVNSISPPPPIALSNNNVNRSHAKHQSNGYAKRSGSGTVSAATGATMASTVRYTDWFGSVVSRRPPVRPPLPSFSPTPSVASPLVDKGGPWDHYVTLDPVYEAPRVVPVQLYTNICLCPDQMMNTKGRKKKKCKKCGCKIATIRHATSSAATKMRPAIPISMYQPTPITPSVPSQHAWGWQVLEERVYEHCELQNQPYQQSPARTLSDEDESPPPTPETVRSVRSVRSARSVKSSDSSATITRDGPEPSRPAPLPPAANRALPPTPDIKLQTSSVSSAKDLKQTETVNSRNSILLENPSAYQLISRYKRSNSHIGSDTDELSDNAVDVSYDERDSEKSQMTNESYHGKQVNVISIGDESNSSPNRINHSQVSVVRDVNKIRIKCANDQPCAVNIVSNNSDDSSPKKNRLSTFKALNGDSHLSNLNNSKSSSSSTSSLYSSNSGKISSSAKNISANNKTMISNKNTLSNNKSSYSSNKNNSVSNVTRGNNSQNKINTCIVNSTQLNQKNTASPGRRLLPNAKLSSPGSKSSSLSTFTSNQMKKSEMCNGSSSLNKTNETLKSGMKKLHDSSELQRGGNTVRIAGQRMFVLGPNTQNQQDSHSGFSSGDEDSNNVEDDTSDYPLSSPTTTRDSDTDTLPEEDDLPLDTSTSSYNSCTSVVDLDPEVESAAISDKTNTVQTEHWLPARDTIYEEEEGDVDESHTNQSCTEADEDSTLLEDEEEKDASMTSSSASSPIRNEGLHPTLSELLKVKSILKKPPSVDTSSETDSDFYLPTFSEFKQNQRKKKQVQFRSSHEVTVIEDAGESKGRKVSSVRNSRREREKAKEKQKNSYNLIADLQDIYARGNYSSTYRTPLDNEVDTESTKIGDSESDSKVDLASQEVHNKEPKYDEERHRNEVTQKLVEDSNAYKWDLLEESDRSRDGCENEGHSLHRSLREHQTSNVSTFGSQDDKRLQASAHKNSFLSSFSTHCPPRNTPVRQAPPPPKSRTMSPPRPSVPPPPPPTSKAKPSSHATLSSSLGSPRHRPLPSPPLLPSSSPPPLPTSSPPPSPTPPPLPTSPPPMLDSSDNMTVITRATQERSDSQNPPLFSFRSDSASLSPPPQLPAHHSKSSSDLPHPSPSIREVLPPPGSIPVFGNEEEARTATIRGRGAAHSRPSILNTFTSPVPSTAPPASSPPTAPRRRNRNRSLSPEVNDVLSARILRSQTGRGHRTSFLNSLIKDENPYEQITDHIYEELLSNHSPTRSSQNTPKRGASPHKSPSPGKSMFEGASKYEILEYLQDARRRVAINADEEEEDLRLQGLVNSPLEAEMDLEDEEEDQLGVDPPEDHFTVLTSRNRGYRSSNMSSNSDSSENSGLLRSDKERLASGEVERTDSGVGSETSKPSVIVRRGRMGASVSREGDLPLCDDCDSPVDTHVTNSGVVYAPLVCRRCSRRRQERKEILTEIMETEIKYGRDLRVMIDEFYRPILVAGLLTRDQLSEIFLNVEELLEHNRTFALQLRDALEIALDQGDEDLLTVNVAKIFLHAAPMLHAFENYCVRHGSASLLLQTLEKEKELLRIFLKVSQMENTLLRRMNLHSFLMVPVQRVTKYPLLLARLYKATPPTHPSREDCRRAKEKIELHLQYMNNVSCID